MINEHACANHVLSREAGPSWGANLLWGPLLELAHGLLFNFKKQTTSYSSYPEVISSRWAQQPSLGAPGLCLCAGPRNSTD